MLPRRPKTPEERVAVTIERFALDLPERPVGVWIADLRVLHEIVREAERVLVHSDADSSSVSRLCELVGQFNGQPGHRWGDWREPYEAGGGEWWHSRTCQRCHEHQFERCEAPTVQDDARE